MTHRKPINMIPNKTFGLYVEGMVKYIFLFTDNLISISMEKYKQKNFRPDEVIIKAPIITAFECLNNEYSFPCRSKLIDFEIEKQS